MPGPETARNSVTRVIDADTGEIIESALAIPDPGDLIEPGFADFVREEVEQIDDPSVVDEYRRRLAALESYIRGREAKNEVQAAARWAEVRIGEFLGPVVAGQRTDLEPSSTVEGLDHNERHWFRKMAGDRTTVEDCIKGRTSSGNPITSRSGILNTIEKKHLAENPVAYPEGVYRGIVIDPPWPMQKIERHEVPNQYSDLDYPTMSLEEIAELPVPDLANPDGCHLYLWVIHKYLPVGLKLVEDWGFRYECTLTWVKPTGFTPYSWMYNTEHVLFARMGNLSLDRNGLKLSFDAARTRHSAKPDVFYERVVTATPEPRIELFARTEREGFVPWGNEVPSAV